MSAARRLVASPRFLVPAGIVVVGAALRFSTLDLQSYRYDEAVTVGRVLHANFSTTLSEVSHSESTPPLYYLLAWAWSKASVMTCSGGRITEAVHHLRSAFGPGLGVRLSLRPPGGWTHKDGQGRHLPGDPAASPRHSTPEPCLTPA